MVLVLEKVSRPLKCHSNFLVGGGGGGPIHAMDNDHITLACASACRVIM